jgi:hypothetical protein
LIHSTRKTLAEAKDKVEAGEKEKIETAITALEAVAKGDDLQAIKDRTEDLSKAASGLAQRMYEEAAKSGAGASAGTSDAGSSGAGAGGKASDDASSRRVGQRAVREIPRAAGCSDGLAGSQGNADVGAGHPLRLFRFACSG